MAIRKEFDTGIIKYYSFHLGDQGSRLSDWTFEDVKIPAFSGRQAIFMHFLLKEYFYRNMGTTVKRRDTFMEPSYSLIKFRYRAVSEYERKTDTRRSRIDFKKVKQYSQLQIKSWYK